MAQAAPSREAAAHHEAAHAVVAVRLNAREVGCLAIYPAGEGWTGAVKHTSEVLRWAEYGESLRAEALTTAAGRYGHEVFLGPHSPCGSEGWCKDDDLGLEMASKAVVKRVYEPEEDSDSLKARRKEWIGDLKDEAKQIVEANWALVGEVAQVLLSAPRETLPVTIKGVPDSVVGHMIGGERLVDIIMGHG